MNAEARQSGAFAPVFQRPQVFILTLGRAGVQSAQNLRSEVMNRRNFAFGRKRHARPNLKIQPLACRAIHGATVEIKPVNVNASLRLASGLTVKRGQARRQRRTAQESIRRPATKAGDYIGERNLGLGIASAHTIRKLGFLRGGTGRGEGADEEAESDGETRAGCEETVAAG